MFHFLFLIFKGHRQEPEHSSTIIAGSVYVCVKRVCLEVIFALYIMKQVNVTQHVLV